jgi:predicted cupin superfamily sugar epimerase
MERPFEDEAMNAEEIIHLLGLRPLREEGGYFNEIYKCQELIPRKALPERYRGKRSFGTAIYYLLTPDQVSSLHRLESDEIFHFYLGDPVTMLQLHPSGDSEVLTLGQDIAGGHRLQVVVPRGTWQGSLLNEGGEFALMGCTVAPGFEYADYEAGSRGDLLKEYPEHEELITLLTPR